MGYVILFAMWVLKANSFVITPAMWATAISFTALCEGLALIKWALTK